MREIRPSGSMRGGDCVPSTLRLISTFRGRETNAEEMPWPGPKEAITACRRTRPDVWTGRTLR
jgi:hypothetical protein